MTPRARPPGNRIRKATWLALACLLVILTGMASGHAQGQLPTTTAQQYRVYLPGIQQPYHVFIPLLIPSLQWSQSPLDKAFSALLPLPRPRSASAGSPSLGASRGFVRRQGENLQLDGQPYTFIGVNVSYLAGPFFPEEGMEKTVAYLAANGVQAIRVWVEPWCDLDRVERMLDLAREYDIHVVLTLQDFFGQESGHWFRVEYLTKDLPHIRRIVGRFAERPEVLMWELMNEPTCPTKDSDKDCWDALYHWAQVTSQAVKRLDPNHLVAVGTQRAGFSPPAIATFRRIHALDSIDIVSMHNEVGKLAQGEMDKEIAIARELGKPLYLGEVAMRGHDESCQPLGGDALQRRAQAVTVDIQHSLEAGIDGYLLWEYAHGGVDMGSHIQYFCSVYGYFAEDPVWKVIQAASRP